MWAPLLVLSGSKRAFHQSIVPRSLSMQSSSPPTVFIKNCFYGGSTTTPPKAVIVLNSPTLGDYERGLLMNMFLSQGVSFCDEHSKHGDGVPRRKPLFICADGAYARVAGLKPPTLLEHAVDLVVGDGDSLTWWKNAAVADAVERNGGDRFSAKEGAAFPTVAEIVLQNAADFGGVINGGVVDAATPSGSRPGGDSERVACSSPARNRRATGGGDFKLLEDCSRNRQTLFVRVLDQNSTDFEKCLTVCERVLETLTPLTEMKQASQEFQTVSRRHEVLVLGFQGGEWHHEIAALHAGAKYSAGSSTTLDLRFHARSSTIAFCNPNGRTVFERNASFENHTFALIPFGASPRQLSTTGLKWNVAVVAPDMTSKDPPPPHSPQMGARYFGFTNAADRHSFISTSNRIVDAQGRVVIDAECSEACAIALAIHLNNDEKQQPMGEASHSGGDGGMKRIQEHHPRVGVAIVVYRRVEERGGQVEYLLVQRGKEPNKNLWACPGGSVEWGESTSAAAVRELREETCLVVDGQTVSLPFGDRPVLVSDVRIPSNSAGNHGAVVKHHYVLIHFVVQVHHCLDPVVAGNGDASPLKARDDATALAWKTQGEIEILERSGHCVEGIADAIRRIYVTHIGAAGMTQSSSKL